MRLDTTGNGEFPIPNSESLKAKPNLAADVQSRVEIAQDPAFNDLVKLLQKGSEYGYDMCAKLLLDEEQVNNILVDLGRYSTVELSYLVMMISFAKEHVNHGLEIPSLEFLEQLSLIDKPVTQAFEALNISEFDSPISMAIASIRENR